MLQLAMRNLFQNRVRFLISGGGAALAFVLILTLDGIFLGLESQLTAYMDDSGADIYVSQTGVRNMHMASSTLPAAVVDEIKAVPGVQGATSILFATNMVNLGQDQLATYVIGLPPDATIGDPWQLAAGTAIPAEGQAVVDNGLARKAGLKLGDKITTLGKQFTIAGLSEGTSNFMNAITFISMADFARLSGTNQSVSFVLVKVTSGIAPGEVVAQIASAVPNVTVQTRQEFADQERKLVNDMSSDFVGIMNFIGLLIGLAVIALTTYIATLSRRGEYGVLKAIGARGRQLYRVVLAQGVVSVVAGLTMALVLTLLLSAIVPTFIPNLTIEISPLSLMQLAGVSLVIATISSIVPIWQIVGLEPALIVRGGK
jgi:putative ABC transport system permease protein